MEEPSGVLLFHVPVMGQISLMRTMLKVFSYPSHVSPTVTEWLKLKHNFLPYLTANVYQLSLSLSPK